MTGQEAPRVVLTCGVAGSGKTTFAKQLEATGYVRLSVDDEVRKRLDSGVLTPAADARLVSIAIEEDIRARLIDLVRQGRDVVVDFSFWKRSARDAYRKLVEDSGGQVELVYFRHDPADEVVPRGESTSLDRYIPDFEIPADDEGAIVIEGYSGKHAVSQGKAFVLDVLDMLYPLNVRERAMFGAYGIDCNEKFVIIIGDDQVFIKRSPADPVYLHGTELAAPYEGATDWHLVPEDLLREAEWLREAVQATADALPAPRPKKVRAKKRARQPSGQTTDDTK